MATWTDTYRCTDCGRGLPKPGTCAECKIRNQPDDQPDDKGGK